MAPPRDAEKESAERQALQARVRTLEEEKVSLRSEREQAREQLAALRTDVDQARRGSSPG